MIPLRYSQGLLDFHTHSTYSDGGDTPSELVRRAKAKGVTALALTDHHTTKGLAEFRKACETHDIFGIPFGVEIGAELPDEVLTPTDNDAPDLIILGKNPNTTPFEKYHDIYFRYMETIWLPETLQKLRQEGFDIPNVDIHKECATCHCPPDILINFVNYSDNITRLVKYVKERDLNQTEEKIRQRPFESAVKFLYSVNCPAYVKRVAGFTVDDALNLADEMNCKLFIAHPGGEFGALTPKILDYYLSRGMKGIEVRNYFNTPEQNAFFDAYAKQHNLVRSGGSDYHGDLKKSQLGMADRSQNQLPKIMLEKLLDNLPA